MSFRNKVVSHLASRLRKGQLDNAESLVGKDNIKAAEKLVENAIDLEGAADLEPDDYARAFKILSLAKNLKAKIIQAEAESLGIRLDSILPGPAVSFESKPIPDNLRPSLDAFVGRDPELLELGRLLSTPHIRLLTIHGPGRMGKSRLAMQAASDQVSEGKFRDGVFFISLETLATGEQMSRAIAFSIGFDVNKADGLDEVKFYLSNLRIFLILDNFDHLTDSTQLITDLFEFCQNLKILFTSRGNLNLSQEHIFTLYW